MTPEEANAWLDLNDINVVRTEGVTPDGVVFGKHLSRAKFERSLPIGPAVADLAFAYDVGGNPYIGWWDDWRQECLGDMHQRPDLATLKAVPGRPREAVCFVDHVGVDGGPLPVCPRVILKKVVDRLASLGYEAKAACELEGMAFQISYTGAQTRGYRDLPPLGTPKILAYSSHDAHVMKPMFDEVVRRMDGYGVDWEAWSAEAAPGQFEINFRAADPVTAADTIVRVKSILREVAVETGRSVTFMAKTTEAYGSGMHIHHSLTKNGAPAFYDTTPQRSGGADGRTDLLRNWIGGLCATMPAAQSFLSPTINSYRRLVEFAAAPTVVSWAEDNKSVALRVISRSAGLARVEHRAGAGDLNPYLALAAILAGGIAGIEQGLEPPEESKGLLAWGLPDHYPYLPRTITAAADALEQDKLLTDVLGAPMVHHWVNTRRWEWTMFHTSGGDAEAKSVTDWELERYFELI